MQWLSSLREVASADQVWWRESSLFHPGWSNAQCLSLDWEEVRGADNSNSGIHFDGCQQVSELCFSSPASIQPIVMKTYGVRNALGRDTVDENLLQVNIFFNSLNVQVIEEKPIYEASKAVLPLSTSPT